MTREEVWDWLIAHNCHPEKIEGVNVTGNSIRVVNRDKPSRYAYFKLPINDKIMPCNYVRKLCVDDLWIPCPDDCLRELGLR